MYVSNTCILKMWLNMSPTAILALKVSLLQQKAKLLLEFVR